MWRPGESWPSKDGECLLVDERSGRWYAQGVERTDLVADAPDLDSLRPAIVEAAADRRRAEDPGAGPWKVAYLWTIEVTARPTGVFGALRAASTGGGGGPVLEVKPDRVTGLVALHADGTTVAAASLRELSQRARQRYAPAGMVKPPSAITLYEVLDIPGD